MMRKMVLVLAAGLGIATAQGQLLGTAPRGGQEIFARDFSTAGELPEGWTVPGGSWEVRDGKLLGRGKEGWGCLLAPATLTNVAIEARVATVAAGEPTRWVGLVARHDGGKHAYTSFTNRFNRAASNGLEVACHGVWEEGKPGWNVIARQGFRDKQSNEAERLLRLEVVGTVARCFIDGKWVLESIVPEQSVLSGQPGIFLSGVDVEIASLRVEELSPLTEMEATVIRETQTAHPLIIAHRGCSLEYPENTLDAILAAPKLGADVVEIDLRLSQDGVPYLFHDDTLDRVTDGTGKVSERTVAELKQLTVTNQRTGRTAPICTFEEAILAAKSGGFYLNIDLKETRAVPAMAEILKKHGMENRVIIGCSSSLSLIRSIREVLPTTQILVITGSRSFDDGELDALRGAGISGFSIQNANPQPILMRQARLHGMTIYNWTVNSPRIARRAARQGVDGIVTDDPEGIYQALRGEPVADASEEP